MKVLNLSHFSLLESESDLCLGVVIEDELNIEDILLIEVHTTFKDDIHFCKWSLDRTETMRSSDMVKPIHESWLTKEYRLTSQDTALLCD